MSNNRDMRGASSGNSAGECPDALTVAAYLDGRLEGAELAAVERHLAACRKCATDVLELRELLDNVAGDEPGREEHVREAADKAKKLVRG
ncbi:hypothetical protein NNJEOMEG_02209 [Fundidesulfovibrio magnetotacticus]|uniref:Putative zinc-finger domain-containing protein n=1 Tax=Fundidesulfovibrio magnetotacticus TaxID=2730080 RepID=A0A6V8M1N9_9BACT|nr:zf-HC2 domain-containing protein [Fundidesulfovibrio magnetotacticus]GFK94365.1 hypothetical protein NNJEOMEG_02209 [Fundidesulfovibrio magnetotacticus]